MSARPYREPRGPKTVIPATPTGDRTLAIRHVQRGVWLQIHTGNKRASITVPWSALRDAIEGAPSGLGMTDVEDELEHRMERAS